MVARLRGQRDAAARHVRPLAGSTSRSCSTSACGSRGCCSAAASTPSVVADYGMSERDAEVVIAAGCLFHCVGMSIHRDDHERYSLFLTADKLGSLLDGVYEEPERSIIVSEALHAIIGHRAPGAVHGRGADRPRRRRARHGPGPLAGAVRGRPAEHPLAVGLRDRGGQDLPGARPRGAGRDRDVQQRRDLPGRRAAGRPSSAARGWRSTSR